MNVLIVLNYQREIPPFMQIELQYAEKVFDKIYYISPSISNGEFFDKYQKISLVEIDRAKKPLNMFLACFLIFKKPFSVQIWKATKKKALSLSVLKHILQYAYIEKMMSKTIRRVIASLNTEDNICLLSAWFNEVAFVASQMKKKYPAVKAYSFAHAFEIDPTRNRYIEYSFDDEKFLVLDKVFFISRIMQERYIESVNGPLKEIAQKSTVTYLGCEKKKEKIDIKQEDTFHLCTCSSIVELKRLHLVVEALTKWSKTKICWTHLGDGPLNELVKGRAEELQKKNFNVEINFLGKLSNEEVHNYLATKQVDLFLNVSNREGLPVSIMEAMAYGIPVMATNVGGTSEIVNNNNGVLLPVDIDGEQLSLKLEQFVDLDKETQLLMRKNAYDTWRKYFDARKNISDFMKTICCM